MNERDIASLMKGMAPVIRDLIAAAVKPYIEEVAGLRRAVDMIKAADNTDMVRQAVADAIAALPAAEKGEPGVDGRAGEVGLPGAQGRGVSRLLVDAKGHLVATFTDGSTDDVGLIVGKDGAQGPMGREGERGADGVNGRDGADGKSVEVVEVERMIGEAVARISAPKDGTNGKDGAPGPKGDKGDAGPVGRDGLDGKDGAAGKDGERGLDGVNGRDGKLPIVREWTDTVHREGEVVSRRGSTWQASRDTGKEPPHADWICLAMAGRAGVDGRSIIVRGTYSTEAEYSALDLVALNGGSFVAKRDNPGACPGDGWQLVASQGKAGKPGERGAQGPAGRGDPGLPVVKATIDSQGLLTLVNGDGSTVECDLYPVLAKVAV